MKYKGKKIEGRNKEIIPIPRPNGDVVFIAEAIESFKIFEEMILEPKPPVQIRPGGSRVDDKKDKGYLKAVQEYAEKRTDFMVLQSLKATPDLEWETVDFNNPDTWKNYKQELKEAGFNEIELGRIILGVMRANALDESMIEEARNNFLHGQGEPEE